MAQDEIIVSDLKLSSAVTQSEEGTIQTSHHEPPVEIDLTFDPNYIFTKPIDLVNLRWCVEELQMIYERDKFETKISQPGRLSGRRDG